MRLLAFALLASVVVQPVSASPAYALEWALTALKNAMRNGQ